MVTTCIKHQFNLNGTFCNPKINLWSFGVLQGRFAIISNPCRQWSMETISDIMFACVILHNMIIDDEKALELEDLNLRGPVVLSRGLTFEDLMMENHIKLKFLLLLMKKQD